MLPVEAGELIESTNTPLLPLHFCCIPTRLHRLYHVPNNSVASCSNSSVPLIASDRFWWKRENCVWCSRKVALTDSTSRVISAMSCWILARSFPFQKGTKVGSTYR